MQNKIHYQGIVTGIQPDRVLVRITDETGCEGCAGKKSCSIAGNAEKIITVPADSGKYKIGDPVTVSGRNSMGLQAIFYAFIIPLAIVLISLISNYFYPGIMEIYAAILTILLLAVYYLLLYLCRKKLERLFTFTIQ